MNISIRIERLVIDGPPIAYSQRSHLKDSIEAELVRLLTIGSLAPDLCTSGRLPRLTAGEIELQGDEEPQQLGKYIANALYRGIGQ